MSELASMINIGKEMEKKLTAVGIDSYEKLVEAGSKQAFLKLKEKDEAYEKLLQRKEEQRERLERKIESERSNYRYLNNRLRETEEELDRERRKSAWDKHHIFYKKYRIPNYSRQNCWERI